MNTIRDTRVRVQDFTRPQPIKRKQIQTVTQSGGLFYTLGSAPRDTQEMPRLKTPRSAD